MPDWPILLHTLFHYIFLSDQPCIMYDFSLCRSTSCWVATYMSSMDLLIGIFNDVLMACMYVHSSDFLVPVFCVVVSGEPVYYYSLGTGECFHM